MLNDTFFSAIDFVYLFLFSSLAVTSQRSEDVTLTLQSSLLFFGLYIYFCTAVHVSSLSHSDAPQPPSLFTGSHSFLQTHLGGLSLSPGGGRCSKEPLSCCRGWSPRPLTGRPAFLNVTVAPAGDISHQPLRLAVSS